MEILPGLKAAPPWLYGFVHVLVTNYDQPIPGQAQGDALVLSTLNKSKSLTTSWRRSRQDNNGALAFLCSVDDAGANVSKIHFVLG
ncbi:hypothetical protein EYZ11_003532 [Aspergillus tanneri]|uniref:Uncharacterized protein n=1 Tax=Aspergillus tanneri TaxID=1220188 RepID=A0A4S3JMY8_9EURO|nr:hypothetical protein EYZ11_003532 [Aspergillus tanneri]